MNDTGRPDEHYRFIGKPMPRKEDARLITGKGRFTDDFNLDGQAYAVMVRSPYPHARIVAIDAAAAKAMPGVLGVFTGADCAADSLKPIPHDPLPKTKFDMKLTGPAAAPSSSGRICFAGGQGAPCRRSRRHGGGRDQGAGDGRRRSGRSPLRGTALRAAFRRRDAAGRAGGVGRSCRTMSPSTRRSAMPRRPTRPSRARRMS